MLDASQRGALDRRAVGSKRVYLDHPPETMLLVRMLGGIKALIAFVPAIASAFRAQTVTLLIGTRPSTGGEVAIPVLFAGEVGAPWGIAVGAVVEGAQHGGPARGCYWMRLF